MPNFVGDRLEPGKQLNPNDALRSPNEQYQLLQQEDGNLVLSVMGGGISWNSAGQCPEAHTIMQTDGNLVTYSPNGPVCWTSNTPGHPQSWCQLQDDGNLVLYQPVAYWTEPS